MFRTFRGSGTTVFVEKELGLKALLEINPRRREGAVVIILLVEMLGLENNKFLPMAASLATECSFHDRQGSAKLTTEQNRRTHHET
jgi:hypothetical protein